MPAQTRAVVVYALKMSASLVVFGLILFIAAGRVDWPAGWAFIAVSALVQLTVVLVLVPRHPDLLAERSKMQDNTKPWDKILAPAVSMFGPLAWMIVAGLDHRFGWSTPPATGVWLASLGVGLLASLFVVWAMDANRFFAATVRIQTDRGHKVVNQGPYGLLRHPGYGGSLIYDLAVPLMLGSWWAYIPVAITVALIFLRTSLEDRTLRAELPGYAAYAQKVRYRLIPGVW